jgi:EmrB/QacA subfamily drug resistance transporter
MRSLSILGLAALAFALGQTTLIPALADLMEEFHTGSTGVAWTLTGYLVAAAVMTPVMGRLGDMFGKRRMLVISLVAFAAGSVISALGTSLEVVVAGRVVQGIGGGTFPLAFGIVRDEFPRERVAKSIGLLSAIAGVGGGAGLLLGGLLADHVSYHWIFWLGAGMAAAAAVAAALFIPESPVRMPGRVDVRGALVLGAGLTLPLIAISEASHWGWGSARTLGMIAAGLAVLAFWVALERRTDEPLADLSVLAQPPVLMTNLATLLVGFGMFGSFVLLPQIVEAPTATGYGFGLGATDLGLMLLPGAVVMLFAGPLSGSLATRFGSRVPLAIGGAIAAAGLLALGLDHSTRAAIMIWNTLLSVGIGLSFAAMPNLIVEAVRPEQTGEATGFNALVRSVGSSLGSQVTSSVLAGSAVAGSLIPTDHSFTVAFVLSAAVTAVAGATALLIPRAQRHDHPPVADEIGAAAPLAEPAYAGEHR